jgi:hypothetical protein
MRMKAERAIAVLAALAALGLVAAVPGAASGYWLGISADEWETTLGRVTERTNVTLPSFMCFVRDARYSLVEYRYGGLDGRSNLGSAQAPLQSDLYPGSSIEIKFNPRNPSQSLPIVSIPGYRAAHGGTLLLGLPMALGFLYVGRRLWRQGKRTESASMPARAEAARAGDIEH